MHTIRTPWRTVPPVLDTSSWPVCQLVEQRVEFVVDRNMLRPTSAF